MDKDKVMEVCNTTSSEKTTSRPTRLFQPLHSARGKMMQWWITRESLELLKLSIPITLTLVLQQLPLFISLLFVGRISSEDSSLNLDAAALGTSFINITGSAVILGASSASTTLSAQSYGYRNYKRVGVILQRGLLILLLLSAFIISVWLNSESLLLLLQQQPCVAKYTNRYVRIMTLTLPSVVLYMTLQQFLQPQGIVWPFIFVVFLSNVINAVSHAVLIFGLGLGIEGAAGGLVISYASQAIILILYMMIRKLHKETWGGWTVECLNDWLEYLKLAIPGIIMVVAEWAAFEISLLVLGTIDETEQAVSGILISYLTITFMMPYGIGVAGSIRVGNDLGAGDVKRAKRTVCVTLIISGIEILSVVLLTIGLKDSLGKLYNANEEVQRKLNFMTYIIVPLILTDHLQGSISGILRGAGQQFKVAAINITSYYVVGLPIGILLALAADMGAVGMWTGLTIANIVQAISVTVTLVLIKWNKESQIARDRSVANSSKVQAVKEEESNVTVELKDYIYTDGIGGDNIPHDNNDDTDMVAVKDTGMGEGETIDDCEHLIDQPRHMNQQDNEARTSDLNNSNDNPISKDATITHHTYFTGLKSLKPRLIICHAITVSVAIMCLIGSGVVSTITVVPDSLINGNYSECINETMSH